MSQPCLVRVFLRQVTVNLKTLSVGDVIGEDCVLGFDTRQYQVTRRQLDQ